MYIINEYIINNWYALRYNERRNRLNKQYYENWCYKIRLKRKRLIKKDFRILVKKSIFLLSVWFNIIM